MAENLLRRLSVRTPTDEIIAGMTVHTIGEVGALGQRRMSDIRILTRPFHRTREIAISDRRCIGRILTPAGDRTIPMEISDEEF